MCDYRKNVATDFQINHIQNLVHFCSRSYLWNQSLIPFLGRNILLRKTIKKLLEAQDNRYKTKLLVISLIFDDHK